MKIVIAGAGDIGFHLAKLLSAEKQDIILIDTNQEVLDYAQSHLDVMTIRGDSASLEVLRRAEIAKANLFLGVTTSEKNNIFSAILAKKMGAGQTIARVNNPEFLAEEEKNNFAELGIDSLISPLQLAAKEIYRLIKQERVTDIFDFEDGKISLVGLTLDDHSNFLNRTIRDVFPVAANGNGNANVCKPIAILRGNQTFLPHETTFLRQNDHLYFITKKHQIDGVVNMAGKEKRKIRNVMIIGGGNMALSTAELLEDEYNVTIVEKDKEACKDLIERLHHSLVIQGDFTNFELLKEEGLSSMDVFIALTGNTETNILSSLVAKNCGVGKTIAQVENIEYTHISQNIGIDTLINKKLIAANNIFRYVRKGHVEAITSLHGVDAEVIEFLVTKSNRLTKKPLRDLHLPESALVAGVIRGDESMLVDEEFQLQIGDKVIIFTLPEAIGKVEKLFH
ncbi:MAG TPA: Trk system potassium transporter TrkA [Saprospiraceae bacterium]|nr:Trk system potassium transporter TrkA [Saprospiraceae bacterium]MCB9271060.1 Trk system potassium transporter TrkA [Lewinellaceae bacterium]HPG07016.1 Trk system potassium transporter TrkA [Saprospiraceae bacterium]HPQ99683.1 Trk system potassium transporter TrkA [Saprospiraceae bacterium]HQU51957.1 Trk system potassium transporter TrkA [Saprospiraceae bacterium]